MKKLKVLDLCSGIGGFSLGFEWTGGYETVAFCEIEPYPQKVLKKHWPDVPIAGDIRKLSYNRKTQELIYDGEVIYEGSIDLICGGYPCQPFSHAGKRQGEADERHLWPEVHRIVAAIRPTWCVFENVAGHISLGLDQVLSDLENEGYTSQALVIPACAIDAPHRRNRVWIVANASGRRCGRQESGEIQQPGGTETECRSENVANTPRVFPGWQDQRAKRERIGARGQPIDDTNAQGQPIGAGLCPDEPEGQRRPRPSDLGGIVPDTIKPGLERHTGDGQNRDKPGWKREEKNGSIGAPGLCGSEPRNPNFWLPEPNVGGRIDGFSAWLDGFDLEEQHKLLSANGKDNQRARQKLLALRMCDATETIWQEVRGSISISPQEILFTYLRQFQKDSINQTWIQLARAETSEKELRILRGQYVFTGTSYQSENIGQPTEEYSNFMQALPRFLAHYAEKAWVEYCRENAISRGWEEGISRVAHGVPKRVDRLKGLGNAVVPQIPEIIGYAILEAESAQFNHGACGSE